MQREKDIKKVTDRLAKALKTTFSPRQMRGVAVKLVSTIRKRVRSGYGVQGDFKPKQKLDALSPRYIDARKRFKGLDSTTRPGKSNLTLTGQMLRTFKVITVTTKKVTVGFTDDFAGKKAEWVSIQGRPWLGVTNKEFEDMVSNYEKIVKKNVKSQKL